MPRSGNPSKDATVVELDVRPAVTVCPDAGERLDVYATLVDLAHGMRDLADDMADLLPDSPYSMSREQLYLSRTLAGMRSTTSALMAVLS